MRTGDHDDDALVQRLRSGSEEAWAELYRRHQRCVYRFALHMSGSVEVADEATQETFIAFLRQVDGYKEALGTLGGYLVGIARHRVAKLLEQRRPETPWDDREPESAVDPLSDLTRRESLEAVNRAVLGLPSAYREVVVLCELEEMSYDDAARVLECPVGTVRSRLHRGRQMLMERLAPSRKGCAL